MVDPTLQTGVLMALERSINGALALDIGTRKKLMDMAGNSFKIVCTQPDASVFMIIESEGISLRSHYEGGNNEGNASKYTPTATLKGPLTAYLHLLASEDKGAELINGELQFSGNSQPLLEMQNILSELELDWEAELAPLLGDIPTHLLGKGVRHLMQFGQNTKNTFLRHAEEYLHEEGRLLPTQDEAEDFFDDIAKLKERAERLEAKIQRLKAKLG